MGDLFRGHSRKPYQINGEQVPDIKHILQNSAEAKDSDALSQLRCLQQSVHNVLRLQIHHNYGDIHALAHDFCKHAEGDQNFCALGYLAAGYLLKILGIGEDHLAVGRGFPQIFWTFSAASRSEAMNVMSECISHRSFIRFGVAPGGGGHTQLSRPQARG